MDGWIKLHRQIQYSAIWQDNEPFDRRSAWIDLLMMANHSERNILFDGKFMTVERGQIVTSVLKLSEKWGWSRKKTSNFLKSLEGAEMVTIKSTTKGTTVTIVNWDKFQYQGTTEGTAEEQQKNNRRTSKEQQKHTNNNIKNINNYKNEEDSSTSKLKKLEQYYLSGGN